MNARVKCTAKAELIEAALLDKTVCDDLDDDKFSENPGSLKLFLEHPVRPPNHPITHGTSQPFFQIRGHIEFWKEQVVIRGDDALFNGRTRQSGMRIDPDSQGNFQGLQVQ